MLTVFQLLSVRFINSIRGLYFFKISSLQVTESEDVIAERHSDADVAVECSNTKDAWEIMHFHSCSH